VASPNDELSAEEIAELDAYIKAAFAEEVEAAGPIDIPAPKPAETSSDLIEAYPGIDSSKLADKIVDVSGNLGISPGVLAGVIDYESGGTFDPAKLNEAGSGATGLIQFMPETARDLLHGAGEEGFAPSKYRSDNDVRTAKAQNRFANMTAVEQMDWVEKYLSPYKGRLKTVDDVGLAVFYPKALGNPDYNIAADYDRIGPNTGARFRRQNPGIETAGD